MNRNIVANWCQKPEKSLKMIYYTFEVAFRYVINNNTLVVIKQIYLTHHHLILDQVSVPSPTVFDCKDNLSPHPRNDFRQIFCYH